VDTNTAGILAIAIIAAAFFVGKAINDSRKK